MTTRISSLFAAILFLVFNPASGSAQSANRPLPPGIPAYNFVAADTTDYGLYLLAPFKTGSGVQNPKPAMILDAAGYLLWYMSVPAQNVFDFKYHPAAQKYSLVRFISPENAQFIVLDDDFLPLDTFYVSNGARPDPHEFTITSGNTYLLSGVKDSMIDLSGYIFNGQPGSAQTNVTGFVVQEYDQDHQLVFEWNSNDHIHPSQAYGAYGYSASEFDYAHGNAIAEDSDGNLLLSFRNLNAVYKIARPGGNVMWSLGGKTSSFTFPGDYGFSAQHDIQRLPNGHVTIFDNGNMTVPIKHSRAVEYELDTMTWQAKKVWEYRPVPFVFGPAMGNHQTTQERNHLVNFGLIYKPNPAFVLVDDNKNKLTALTFVDSAITYRCFLQQTPAAQLPRPVISCSRTDGVLTLDAPPGYDRYVWSTEETGPTILVTAPGEYQVWVKYGPGMLGSLPLAIDDVTEYCLPSETDTPVLPASDRPISGIYDLLGRPVAHPAAGVMYVVKYRDGGAKVMMVRK